MVLRRALGASYGRHCSLGCHERPAGTANQPGNRLRGHRCRTGRAVEGNPAGDRQRPAHYPEKPNSDQGQRTHPPPGVGRRVPVSRSRSPSR